MLQAYNFLGAWQLFPEKGTYTHGNRPKSGIYKIETQEATKALHISQSWVTLEDQALGANYTTLADGEVNPTQSPDTENIGADAMQVVFDDVIGFQVLFFQSGQCFLTVRHELMPNGYLKVTQTHTGETETYENIEIYHRQLSVLPYSASVSGAIVKPNEAGHIRHTALKAMEEQTNMQLMQIRQQIELLALQAQEIQKRKELSMLIYSAQLRFQPVIGQVYHLYENQDGSHYISMIGPKEWGRKPAFKSYVATVQLLADHTWKEV